MKRSTVRGTGIGRALRGAIGLVLGGGLALGAATTAFAGTVHPDVTAQLAGVRDASVEVIVKFRSPEVQLQRGNQRGLDQLAAGVAQVRNRVIAQVPALAGRTDITTFSHLPLFALTVDQATANAIAAHPDVESVTYAERMQASMLQAGAVAHVPEAVALGYTGAGVTVGVLDTGIDTDHADFTADNAIAARYCAESLDCATPDAVEDVFGHGTHVSGIITRPDGTAPAARIAAIKVLGDDGFSTGTSVIEGLNWVVANHVAHNIRVVNLSLGSSQRWNSIASCDTARPAYPAAFDSLRDIGITPFVATGNDADTTGISSPACNSGAVAVGSSGDAVFPPISFTSCTDTGAVDKVSCFSNTIVDTVTSTSMVTIMAPGCTITSTGLGGGTDTQCGTSMATPFAAGVAANLLGRDGDLTPDSLTEILVDSATNITDYRLTGPAASFQFKRVDLLAAHQLMGAAPPPTDLVADDVSPTQIDLDWVAPADATPTGYRIERLSENETEWVQLDDIGPVLEYSDDAPKCGVQSYRVRSLDATDPQDVLVSTPSNVATATAYDCPLAPSALTANLDGADVDLAWTDGSTDETGFVVQRQVNGGAFTDLTASIPANTTNYTDVGAACGLLGYRVAAVRGSDRSAWTNVASVGMCAPENDLFENALVIDPAFGSETFEEENISLATTSPGDPNHSCRFNGPTPGSHGVWYEISPTVATRLQATTANSDMEDTVMSLFTHDGTTFTSVACNDDIDADFGDYLSSLTFNLEGGTTYYLLVSSWGDLPPGSPATLTLDVTLAEPGVVPANDLIANAIVVPPGAPASYTEPNITNATSTTGDPDYSCSAGGYHGVWYSVTPTTAASMTVTTDGSTGAASDTVLGVFTYNGSAFTQVACDDDAGAGLQSLLSTNLQAGTTYYVFASTYDEAPGETGELKIAFSFGAVVPAPPHDLFANAKVITATPYTDTVAGMQGATVTAGDPNHTCRLGLFGPAPGPGTHNVWYRYTPPATGKLSLDTLQSTGSFDDTVVSVFSGSYPGFATVACNDDATEEEFRSALEDVQVQAGTTYTIYVSRYSSTATTAAGTLVLNADFVEDTFADITVDPAAIELTVATGMSGSETFTIGNEGDGALTWTISEAASDVAGRGYGPGLAGAVPFVSAVGSDRNAARPPVGTPMHVANAAPQGGPVSGNVEENFDDITTLPASGWALINRSNPVGGTSWFQGNPDVFESHEGAPNAYIGANFNNTTGAGTISNWLISPEMELVNGDVISFWTRIPFIDPNDPDAQEFADRLEVRLSNAGASTDVGTTESSVGVFTNLIETINPDLELEVYPQEWTKISYTVTGQPEGATGRVAFRYYVTSGGPQGANSSYIGIDTFFAGTPSACDAGVDQPWLSVSPASGTTAPAASSEVTVTADASDLEPGTYTAQLCINSNDADESLVQVPVELTVVSAIDIAPATLPDGQVGVAYAATITATGDTAIEPFTFSVVDGALPPGLTLFDTGALTGTPTTEGSYTFTVEAADDGSTPMTATIEYTIDIAAGDPVVTITPAELPRALIDTPYSVQLVGGGAGTTGPYTFAVTSGTLPTGVELDADGLLSGVPEQAGTFNFTVTATDSTTGTAYTGTQDYTLEVRDEFIFEDGFETLEAPSIVLEDSGKQRVTLAIADAIAASGSDGQQPVAVLVFKGRRVGVVEARCAAGACDVRVVSRGADAKVRTTDWWPLSSDPYTIEVDVGTRVLVDVQPIAE